MKRKIKFRAWDKIECQMLFSGIDYQLRLISHICQDEFADESVIGFSRLDWDRFELMQFTGLLDRRGKEIYEGDIVHVINVMKSKRPYNTDIYYDAPQFKLRVNHTYLYDFAAMRGTEVIGNIYENPELLNK